MYPPITDNLVTTMNHTNTNPAHHSSVLFGEPYLLIQLPYTVINSDVNDDAMVEVIMTALQTLHQYATSDQYLHDKDLRYPTKQSIMYHDLLEFTNQYLNIELNFEDLIYITKKSISSGAYHTDLYFAYCIDLEFEDNQHDTT